MHPKGDVGTGHGGQGRRFSEISRERLDACSEAKALDEIPQHLDLEPADVAGEGIEDPVEVLLLDPIRVDQNQPPHAETGENVDHHAASPGAADDHNCEGAERVERPAPERLGMTDSELRQAGNVDRASSDFARTEYPELVADHRHGVELGDRAVGVMGSAEDPAARQQDGAGVGMIAIDPAMDGGEERCVGDIVHAAELRVAARVAVDLENAEAPSHPVLGACWLVVAGGPVGGI
jgi:hypothetical protein